MSKNTERRTIIGIVVSNKMDKTAVVSVTRRVQHPLYKKIIKRTTKYKVHDAENACNMGDKVRIAETRPLSKTKAFELIEIVERAS